MIPKIDSIQNELRAEGLDGWLFYDFHNRDPIAARVLGLEPNGLATRRWFYLIPARGTPSKLVHRIESRTLDVLPGRKWLYAGQQELHASLKRLLRSARKVAMQYSPRNAIPYVSMVDAGTIELVREQSCKVVSSADLIQKFEARWTPGQYRSHLDAARSIDRIILGAFRRAARLVKANEQLSEYQLQQWILKRFRAAGIVTAAPPVVAVDAHTADPHYEPRLKGSAAIRRGSLLLLDVWGKRNRPDSVYYDITWIGYLGARVPEKYAKIFAVVSQARDAAVSFVQQSMSRRRAIQGWQVDDAAREVIRKAGYSKFFVHRTGHNIGQEVHGNGANMDNLETHDSRRLLPRTCFSVEPGIYLPEFGVRSELNVYLDDEQVRVTGPVQTDILPLLA